MRRLKKNVTRLGARGSKFLLIFQHLLRLHGIGSYLAARAIGMGAGG
jgi:hypothetical protein